MKKRIFAMLLVCALAVGLAPVRAAGATQFAGGDGTAANPYQVATAEQLDAVRYDLSAHYLQLADIDLRGIEWLPIGYSALYSEEPGTFEGSYDGNGYSINNMTIEKTFTSADHANRETYLGLVTRNTGKIRNVSLKNCKISIEIGEDIELESLYLHVGGVVAYSGADRECALDKCLASGEITIKNLYGGRIGGIAGTAYGCKNAVNYINIHVEGTDKYCYRGGDTCCGGIAGGGGRTENCINYGTISASGHGYLECGGIIGDGTPVKDCTNCGDISGKVLLYTGWRSGSGHCLVGGIAGEAMGMADYSAASISGCFNYGNVTASSVEKTSDYAGGIVGGMSFWDGNIVDCYNMGDRITAEYAGRISAGPFGSHSEGLYSLDTTLVNGEIPTEEIGESYRNGQSLSLAEIKARVPGNGYWPSTWAEAEVNNARDNGLIPAELDGNYTGNITRAEFCNLGVKLVKSLGKENQVFNKATVVLDGKRFSDTNDENVIAMCNAGVVNGYTDGRFGPNDPITREQAAVMLARLARKLGGDLRNGLEPQYRDGLSISAWAREDVAYISRCETAGHKAVMGGSNGYFSPKNYYTREQAFLTFQRLYECATNTASGAGTSSGRIEPENNMEKGEQALAQRAVELVQTLSDQAKAKEANPFLGQEDQLEALKKTIHVTPTAGLNSDKDIPDAVYYAFAGAIYEAMEDSSIEKLEYDGNKLVNQIYDAVKNGLLNGTKTVAVTTGKGKNRTTTSYTVTYRITTLAGAQTSEATVSWNNGSKRVLLTSADVAGTQKALANFCAALAQLNKEAWNEFLACYFGNAFGLMGFDIKKDDVKKALSVSEKVIKAIDDPREADKFLAEAGDELSQSVKDQLKSGWFDSEIGKLVKECVPNGDKIVEAAKVYLKVREKYDAWTSAVEARKNMDEVQKLYADFSGVLSELDSILNEIAP